MTAAGSIRGGTALRDMARLHDLHIWPMSTTDTALTVHLVMPGGHPGDVFLRRAADGLEHSFGIEHATFQIEVTHESACRLAPDHVV